MRAGTTAVVTVSASVMRTAALRFEYGRGFWVLRATADSAFLLGVFHFSWRMMTGVFLGIAGERGQDLAAMVFRVADALSLLLPGFLVSLAVRLVYEDLVRQRDALFESL